MSRACSVVHSLTLAAPTIADARFGPAPANSTVWTCASTSWSAIWAIIGSIRVSTAAIMSGSSSRAARSGVDGSRRSVMRTANSSSNASAAVEDWVGQPTRVASIFSAAVASCWRVDPSVLVSATVYDPWCWATRSASTVRVVSPELDSAITAVPSSTDRRGSRRARRLCIVSHGTPSADSSASRPAIMTARESPRRRGYARSPRRGDRRDVGAARFASGRPDRVGLADHLG